MKVNVTSTERRQSLICKIRSVGDCYYTTEGISSIQELAFDLFSSARAACMQPGTLADRASFFQRTVYPQVVRVFAQQERAPLIKTQNIAAVFAGIEAEEPRIVIVNFWQDPKGVLRQHRQEFHGHDLNLDSQVVTLGVFGAIEKVRRRHPLTYAAGPPATAVERLLRLEIEDSKTTPFHEQRVGPPIAIVELSKAGARWIYNGTCQVSGAKPKRLPSAPKRVLNPVFLRSEAIAMEADLSITQTGIFFLRRQ